MNFAASWVLARYLLSPEDFGLMGLCLTAIQYLDLMNSFGSGSALIAQREKLEEAANAGFVISVGLSVFLFILGYVASPSISGFFYEPRFIPLFRLLILSLPISAISVIPSSILSRNLNFKTLLIPDLGMGLFKGLVSVLLAFKGYGVWSLIWGQIAGEAAFLVGSWWTSGWRPTWVFDRGIFLKMLNYGWNIMSVGFIGTFIQNVDYILVGRILGTLALGFYTLAYRIPELIIRSINLVVGRVAFPVLAKLQMEREHLQYIYLNYLSYISMVVIPAGVGLTLVTSPLVLIVYTDKWFDSIQPMQWISLGIAISALGHIPGVLYKAIDRPDILNKLSMIKLPITVAVLWVSTRWGIVGVAVGQLIMGVIKVLMDLGVAQYTIGISTRHTIKSIAPAFAGSLVMAAVLIPLALFIKLPDSILLVIMVVVGGGVYIGSMMMFNRKLLVDAWSVVKSALPNAGQR